MIPHCVLGERGSGGVYLVDSGHRDGVTTYSFRVESLPIAPAGLQGEAIFQKLVLAVEHTMATDLVVTPIIDGTEEDPITVALSAEDSRARKVLDLALWKGVEDGSGTERFRMPLRGTWMVLRVEADVADGDLVLERVEIEAYPVGEARAEENAT